MAELNLSKRYDFAETRRVQYDDEGKIHLVIAPLSCREYQDWMDEYARQIEAMTRGSRRSQRRHAQIERELKDRIREGLARFIIRDWSGVQDENGREVPYTWEEGLRLLEDPERGDSFYVDVMADAQDFDAFRRKRIEESEKNSPALSGSSEPSESAQTASRDRKLTAISSAAS